MKHILALYLLLCVIATPLVVKGQQIRDANELIAGLKNELSLGQQMVRTETDKYPAILKKGATYKFRSKNYYPSISASNTDYSQPFEGMLHKPQAYYTIEINQNQIIFHFRDMIQVACGFDKNGNPVPPADVSWSASTKKETKTGRIRTFSGEILNCTFTQSAIHLMFQTPRNTVLLGGVNLSDPEYLERQALESGGIYQRESLGNEVNHAKRTIKSRDDPFAPWRIVQDQTVSISLNDIAASNKLTKDQLVWTLYFTDFTETALGVTKLSYEANISLHFILSKIFNLDTKVPQQKTFLSKWQEIWEKEKQRIKEAEELARAEAEKARKEAEELEAKKAEAAANGIYLVYSSQELKDAVEDSSNKKNANDIIRIKLEKDLALDEELRFSDGNIILDLANHVLNLKGLSFSGKELTILDGTITGEAKKYDSFIHVSSNTKIESCKLTISGEGNLISCANGGNLKISGDSYLEAGGHCIYIYKGDAVIEAGRFLSRFDSAIDCDNGTIAISGNPYLESESNMSAPIEIFKKGICELGECTLKSKDNALIVWGGKLNISKGYDIYDGESKAKKEKIKGDIFIGGKDKVITVKKTI